MPVHELIASKRAGSAIVEMAFALAAIPLTVTTIPYLQAGSERDRLLALNPLGQVPTLILPDGGTMTESAAMILYLNDLAPDARLLPPIGAPDRPSFLNRLIILVGAIYPTFTYGDKPDDWTGPGEAAATLLDRIDARRAMLWRGMDAWATPSPFLHGVAPGALDLYVATMTQWQPRFAWFERETSKLASAALAVAAHPLLKSIMKRNFTDVSSP